MGKRKRVDPVRWPGVYQYETRKGGKPDLVYYISFKDGSRKIWEKVGMKSEGMTPQVADDIRKERTLKARHGEKVLTAKQIKKERARANKALDDIADAYFEQRGGSKQAAKFDRLRYDKHVKPVLGSRPVSTITVLDIQRVKNNMAGKASATIWGALELIRRIANYGKKAGLSPGLNFIIEMPRRDNEVVEFLTPDQVARLLKTLDQWPSQDVANMLRLAMFSGMRRGEIFKLQDQDLDFANNLITLRRPKGGKTTSVPMNHVVQQILQNQIKWRDEHMPGTKFVFPGKRGGQRTESKAVGRIKIKAELPDSFRIFHGLRHHYAVTLANSGEFSLDMIGELLTHKSNLMTRRYAAYLPDSLKKASHRAAELLMQNSSTPYFSDKNETAKK